MSKIRISIWLTVFMSILIIFNFSFQMVYTPAGLVGKISSANLIASAIYLIAWLVLSIVSGIKRKKEILVAALIYSSLPLLGFSGAIFMGTPLAILIMFYFYWTVPIQGVFVGNELLIGGGTLILQPLVFLIGYSIFNSFKHTTDSKEE